MRPYRSAVLAAFAALAVAAPAAPAAPARPFTWTDPAGDALVSHPSLDVVGATVRTTGRTVARAYRPADLVVTLRVAGPLVAPAGVSYRMALDIPDCGSVELVYAPGTVYSVTNTDAWMFGSDCIDPAPTVAGTTVYVTPLRAVVSGATVTWTVPLRLLGVERGTEFAGLVATTEVTEPAFGFFGSGVAVVDSAAAPHAWRLG